MEVKLIRKSDGFEYPGDMFFINHESDDGSASLQTTLRNVLDKYDIVINGIIFNG